MASEAIFIDLDKTCQWFVFRSPYNESFIFELKARISPTYRRWRGEEKAWCVAKEKWAIAEELMRKHYGHSILIEVGPAAEAAQIDLMVEEVHEPTANDYMKIGVRADAPHCVLHAAYHALEALWGSNDREEIRLLGVYPIEEIRAAYKRACQLRDIQEDPSAFKRSSSAAAPLLSSTLHAEMLSAKALPSPKNPDAYDGPRLDVYTQSQPTAFIDFIDEGTNK